MQQNFIKVCMIYWGLPVKRNYVLAFAEGFKNMHDVSIIFYAEKIARAPSNITAKKNWTQLLFPFQIFKAALADRPHVIHIQYALDTFGGTYTNLLVPLLLLFLRISGHPIVVNIHTVIHPSVINDKFIRKLTSTKIPTSIFAFLVKLAFVLIYKTISATASAIIVWNSYFKNVLVKSYGIVPSKVYVIPHGVETPQQISKEYLDLWRARLGKDKMILYFGTVSPRKDLKTLVKAFKLVLEKQLNFKLVIAGATPRRYVSYKNELLALVEAPGLRNKIIFAGFVDDEEIPVIYSLAELCVLPYVFAVEGPSGPLSFAITYGTPCVMSDAGCTREEMNNMSNDIFYAVGNHKKLADAIGLLIANDNLRNRISQNLRAKAATRSWEQIAIATYKLYRHILQSANKT